MIVRPIAHLPSIYLEEPRLVAICKANSDTFEWQLGVWDPHIRAWFIGNVREFLNWKNSPDEDEEWSYCVEPTHFFELPELPRRMRTH